MSTNFVKFAHFLWLVLLQLVLSSTSCYAHQTEVSSTMLVEQPNNVWIVQVRAALTAFEHEIHQAYGRDAYQDPEAFQALVIDHIEKHLSISFNNDHRLRLTNGHVQLGHETSASFKLELVPNESLEQMSVQNEVFANITRSQSAFLLFRPDTDPAQFVLTAANDYSVLLDQEAGVFVAATAPSLSINSFSWLWLIVGILLLFGLVLKFRQQRRNAYAWQEV